MILVLDAQALPVQFHQGQAPWTTSSTLAKLGSYHPFPTPSWSNFGWDKIGFEAQMWKRTSCGLYFVLWRCIGCHTSTNEYCRKLVDKYVFANWFYLGKM